MYYSGCRSKRVVWVAKLSRSLVRLRKKIRLLSKGVVNVDLNLLNVPRKTDASKNLIYMKVAWPRGGGLLEVAQSRSLPARLAL